MLGLAPVKRLSSAASSALKLSILISYLDILALRWDKLLTAWGYTGIMWGDRHSNSSFPIWDNQTTEIYVTRSEFVFKTHVCFKGPVFHSSMKTERSRRLCEIGPDSPSSGQPISAGQWHGSLWTSEELADRQRKDWVHWVKCRR